MARYAGAEDPITQAVGPAPEIEAPHTDETVHAVTSDDYQQPQREPERIPDNGPTVPASLVPAQHIQGYRTPQNFSAHGTQPLSPYQQSYDRLQRPTGTRKESMGGGMQVVLGETGSWSDLAKQDATLPADAKELTAKPNGMLGFLSRKKGRGHSPKPQERGILGKEGARVVISNN